LSSEREAARLAFLSDARLADARRERLPGDASTRLYERLHPATGGTLILMDQPPSLESQPCPPDATPEQRAALGYNALTRLAAGRVDAFICVAGWLRSQGLSAPKVIASDAPQGFAVLEDLGDALFARLLEDGADEGALYDGATDVLLALHGATPPDVLTAGDHVWPLLAYDGVALATYTDLFVEWFPKLIGAPAFDDDAKAEWDALWAPARALADRGASVFCHRDFHAENLIWLPDRAGAARVGLLDFQDAVRAHPAWDLSMLLHDARRDVTPEREAAVLARYLAARPDLDREGFIADFHTLGAINIIRILGLFARLVVNAGKPRYRAFMPRLWRYLDRCLEGGGGRRPRAWLDRHVPAEARL
jgi:aminoglycoside/choline kinase family phosphotransferase